MKRFLAGYKFVVAVENAACPDYVTEKLWRALQVAIPGGYHREKSYSKFGKM